MLTPGTAAAVRSPDAVEVGAGVPSSGCPGTSGETGLTGVVPVPGRRPAWLDLPVAYATGPGGRPGTPRPNPEPGGPFIALGWSSPAPLPL